MRRTISTSLAAIAGTLLVSWILTAGVSHRPAFARVVLASAPASPEEKIDRENREYVRAWAEREFPPELRAKPIEFFTDLTRTVATRTKLGFAKGDSQSSFAAYVIRERIGQCGETAAVVKTIAEEFGYPARYVNLNNFPKTGVGHTQVEVWIDGAWHLFDPTFGVVYRDEKGRLLSFGLLHQRPELADRYRTKLGTSIPSDNRLFELFTGSLAFAARDSSGPVGSLYPTVYQFPIPVGPADAEGVVWKLGKVDSSGEDLVDSNPNGGLAVGYTFVGDGVLTNNLHRYKFHGMVPGRPYQMKFWFRGGSPNFAARLDEVRGARIDGGWSFSLDRKAHPAVWTVCFTPDSTDAEFTLWHPVRGRACYGQLDALELRESRGDCPAAAPAFPLPVPPQTPIDRGAPDAAGIVREKLPDGRLVYSPFTVALQAMEGAAGLEKYKTVEGRAAGLIPRLEGSTPSTDPVAKNALGWLLNNAFELSDGSLVWYYEFENTYNNIITQPPWPSAFGQAYVLRALVHAAQNGDSAARAAAVRAADAFAVPIENGGFRSTLPGGEWFFEEVPAVPAPHILNGHMVSTLTLFEAADALKNEKIRGYADQGLKTLRAILPLYDTGYWSRYDLNPKNTEWIVQVAPESAAAKIGVISVALVSEAAGSVRRADALSGDGLANRIVGLDWGAVRHHNGQPYREPAFGPDLHAAAVRGGTRQNSYAILEPPGPSGAERSRPDPLILEVEYLDLGAGEVSLRSQSIAHGNTLQFVPIPGGTIQLLGDGLRKVAKIPVPAQAFGWFMGVDYQTYHVELLQKLSARTKDAMLADYAARWAKYLQQWSDPMPEPEAQPAKAAH